MMNYNNPDLVEIARIFTFATANRRDIVRRLMGSCESFKRLTFPDALAQFLIFCFSHTISLTLPSGSSDNRT